MVMDKLILIKYGELTTKKANRNVFIGILTNRIQAVLKNYEIKIEKDRVRMYISCHGKDLSSVLEELKKLIDEMIRKQLTKGTFIPKAIEAKDENVIEDLEEDIEE